MSEYDPEEFQRNKESYTKRQRRYKEKHKEVINAKQREYRKRNKDKLKAYAQKKYEEQSLWVRKYKEKRCCVRCGFDNPAALVFHHRDPQTKEFGVSTKIGKISLERIKKEIAKCDLLCANCHALEHHQSDSMQGL